jgi:hypothetical protein
MLAKRADNLLSIASLFLFLRIFPELYSHFYDKSKRGPHITAFLMTLFPEKAQRRIWPNLCCP